MDKQRVADLNRQIEELTSTIRDMERGESWSPHVSPHIIETRYIPRLNALYRQLAAEWEG